MHEVVMVLSDLYLPGGPDGGPPSGSPTAHPGAERGLMQLMRFGRPRALQSDWRDWLAQQLGVRRSADCAAATFCSALLAETLPGAVDWKSAWMATPVHLIAGLSSVHLDRRGLLKLSAGEQHELADDFSKVFHDSGFQLAPARSGGFLLLGRDIGPVRTVEPARVIGTNVVEALPTGEGATALRRLNAEIEMWLHDHAVNDSRRHRRELPVTTLWLWGGGAYAGNAGQTQSVVTTTGEIAFGDDAYLHGLWAQVSGTVLPLPQNLSHIFSYPHAQRAVLVVEVAPLLQSNPSWTVLEALAQIDRQFLWPAVESLHRGEFQRLQLVANDRLLRLHSRDRYKLWRRMPRGLAGLQ